MTRSPVRGSNSCPLAPVLMALPTELAASPCRVVAAIVVVLERLELFLVDTVEEDGGDESGTSDCHRAGS